MTAQVQAAVAVLSRVARVARAFWSALTRRVPRGVWPFLVLSVFLAVAAIVALRFWLLPVVGAVAVLAGGIDWANGRRRHPAAAAGHGAATLDRLALGLQLAVLVVAGTVAVLAALSLCGVAAPAWAGLR